MFGFLFISENAKQMEGRKRGSELSCFIHGLYNSTYTTRFVIMQIYFAPYFDDFSYVKWRGGSKEILSRKIGNAMFSPPLFSFLYFIHTHTENKKKAWAESASFFFRWLYSIHVVII